MKARFRVGCVPYVNARPLVACFDQPNELVEVVYDVPSRLPALLDSGEVDAILVSSIEYLRRDDLVIAADVGIMSNGPVASVRMLSKVPLEEIKTLALDESSMTSNMLAQIILAERGVRPSLVTMEPDQAAMLAACDACVLIGDKGLEADGTGLVDVDLGAAWTELTGEPFVWALWLMREDRFPAPRWDHIYEPELLRDVLVLAEVDSSFGWVHNLEDFRLGRLPSSDPAKSEVALLELVEGTASRREFVIKNAAVRSGWSEDKVESYLSKNVRFSGGISTSLKTFQALLSEHSFLERSRRISTTFDNCSLESEMAKLFPDYKDRKPIRSLLRG
jgi:predicted solute-binding protein